MTRWLAVSAALVSIGAISLVLRWGATGRAGTPPFESAVFVLTFATPLASLLLAWQLWRQRHRGGAVLSSTPLALMVGGFALALGGTPLPLRLLLWLDLYVLLVFVVVLSRFGRDILRPPRMDAAAKSFPRRPAS
jgi:hypothetical protein